MKRLAAIVVLLSLSGCAQSFYAKQCARAGAPEGSEQNRSCVANAIAEGQRDALGTIAAGAVIGAVASSSGTQPMPQSSRSAPLVNQTTSGYQRTCIYQGPTGNMSLVVSTAQSCPARLSY